MRSSLLLLLLATAGCYAETTFTPARTEAYCDLVLECAEPAVLAFDGVTPDTCTGVYGPGFAAEGAGCKLNRKAAKACVEGMEAMACPPDGEAVDDHLPVSCENVFIKCGAATPDEAN